EGEGKGATFTVRLPIRHHRESPVPATGESAERPEQPAVELDTHALDGVTALVVDDDADARVLAKSILERCGAEGRGAKSASEALGQLTTSRPDVIISDIGMPNVDGYDFLMTARRRGIAVPAIALTAYAREEDRQKSLQAGYQGFVAKPLNLGEFVSAV